MGAVDLAKTIKSKDKKDGRVPSAVYESGYYMLGGFVASMIIKELWDHFSPYKGEKIKEALLTGRELKNVKDGIELDKFIIMMTSSGLMLAELMGLKGGIASGSGLVMGYTYMSKAKKGEYIGTV